MGLCAGPQGMLPSGLRITAVLGPRLGAAREGVPGKGPQVSGRGPPQGMAGRVGFEFWVCHPPLYEMVDKAVACLSPSLPICEMSFLLERGSEGDDAH